MPLVNSYYLFFSNYLWSTWVRYKTLSRGSSKWQNNYWSRNKLVVQAYKIVLNSIPLNWLESEPIQSYFEAMRKPLYWNSTLIHHYRKPAICEAYGRITYQGLRLFPPFCRNNVLRKDTWQPKYHYWTIQEGLDSSIIKSIKVLYSLTLLVIQLYNKCII